MEDIVLHSKNEYFKCYCDDKKKFIICETLVSYVPVEAFMAFFEDMVDVIQSKGITKFIFDKRSLRAFHQPTMEWYFVQWKQKLLESGLKTHRKILPQEDWFRKCVEAGKASILKDNPDFDGSKLDIQYFDTITDCIEN